MNNLKILLTISFLCFLFTQNVFSQTAAECNQAHQNIEDFLSTSSDHTAEIRNIMKANPKCFTDQERAMVDLPPYNADKEAARAARQAEAQRKREERQAEAQRKREERRQYNLMKRELRKQCREENLDQIRALNREKKSDQVKLLLEECLENKLADSPFGT